ncbi:MAG: hypothetical protein M1831_006308 [Alyxoria varia]|nr:MAG: hypothetical protein M1831_006308 [Alyxoria varia]
MASYAGFLDFSYALYPAIRIFMLQMPLRKKIGYSVSLGLGFIAWIIVVLKATIVNGEKLESDPTWAYTPYIDWTVIEANVLIVAASTPAITPAIRAIHNQTQLSFSKLRGYGTSRSTQKPSYLDESSNVSKNSQKDVELRTISQMRGPQRAVSPPSKHMDFVTSVLSRDDDRDDYVKYGYKSRPGTRESFRFFRPSGSRDVGDGKESLVGEYRREVDTSFHDVAPFYSTLPTHSATASKV